MIQGSNVSENESSIVKQITEIEIVAEEEDFEFENEESEYESDENTEFVCDYCR